MRRWIMAVGAIGVLTALGAGVRRAQAQTPPERSVTVQADGEARAEPDIAFLNAGVEATAPTPREALAQVNTQVQQVTATLRRLGVADADIQTSGINLYAITAPDRPAVVAAGPGGPTGPGTPQVVGYHASNSVSVTLRDLARVDAMLDGLLEAGITNLNGLRFGIRDTRALHERALANAVEQARPLAEAAARAAGLTVGEVTAIVEESSGGVTSDIASPAFDRSGGAVEVGSLTLRVRVKVTFRLV
jgi:uncharacterized protein YggE